MASARSQFLAARASARASRILAAPRPRRHPCRRPAGGNAQQAQRQLDLGLGELDAKRIEQLDQRIGSSKRSGLVGSVARLLQVLVALGHKAKDSTHGTGSVKSSSMHSLKAARASAALAANASDAASSASAVAWFAAQRRFSTVPAMRVSEFSAPSRRSQEKSSAKR